MKKHTLKTSKHQNLKVLALAFALAFAHSLSAQESHSLWMEATPQVRLFNQPNHDYSLVGLSLGVNRQSSEHASWGILLSASFEEDYWGINNEGHPHASELRLAVAGVRTLHYPLTRRLCWTPRFLLSLGYADRSERYPFFTPEGSHWADPVLMRRLPLTLGLQPASFDLQCGKHLAFNVNVNLLDCLLTTAVPLSRTSFLASDTRLQLPLGPRYLAAETPALTVSLRCRF